MPGAVATDGYENPNGCVKKIAAAVAAGQRGRVQIARRIVDAAADRTTGAAKTGVMVLTTPSSVVLPLRPAIIPAP
ncbi:hypothetical protein CCS01_30975 [Rhodopila globiformis]|uniref:Uncharacterized protein n=2 Tax=Rhodopila globiformis TaxID=1071 RepID=A0A2S6MV49_RHOGL|nr:hypothetical protein CCS01_30975 [Rhodopila globiformis]